MQLNELLVGEPNQVLIQLLQLCLVALAMLRLPHAPLFHKLKLRHLAALRETQDAHKHNVGEHGCCFDLTPAETLCRKSASEGLSREKRFYRGI